MDSLCKEFNLTLNDIELAQSLFPSWQENNQKPEVSFADYVRTVYAVKPSAPPSLIDFDEPAFAQPSTLSLSDIQKLATSSDGLESKMEQPVEVIESERFSQKLQSDTGAVEVIERQPKNNNTTLESGRPPKTKARQDLNKRRQQQQPERVLNRSRSAKQSQLSTPVEVIEPEGHFGIEKPMKLDHEIEVIEPEDRLGNEKKERAVEIIESERVLNRSRNKPSSLSSIRQSRLSYRESAIQDLPTLSLPKVSSSSFLDRYETKPEVRQAEDKFNLQNASLIQMAQIQHPLRLLEKKFVQNRSSLHQYLNKETINSFLDKCDECVKNGKCDNNDLFDLKAIEKEKTQFEFAVCSLRNGLKQFNYSESLFNMLKGRQ